MKEKADTPDRNTLLLIAAYVTDIDYETESNNDCHWAPRTSKQLV